MSRLCDAGFMDADTIAKLLPEILLDLKDVLPDHPAVAHIQDLHRRMEAVREELEGLSALADSMASALRNNNYDYLDYACVGGAPGSLLVGGLDRLVASKASAPGPSTMTYTGTVWRGKTGATRFALVEAEPHAGWDETPTVYVRTRAVLDGVRQRTQPSIMTLAALLGRFEQVAREDWPGVL